MIPLAALGALIGAELVASGPAGDVRVTDVSHDSRTVSPGALFACIPGARADGHDYAAAAVAAGACAVLAQRRLPEPLPAPVLMAPSVRRALGPAAAAVHGRPSRRIDLIGVTGTNGKTTTVRMIAGLLASAGFGVEEIGTLTGARTTPEAPELQRRIAAAAARGDRAVAMEVSSHGLAQHRVDGCAFRVAVFTNLGRDHLDFHGSAEAYFRAKARLFEPDMTERAVINTTTPAGRRLADAVAGRVAVTEVGEQSAQEVRVGARSSRFRWRGRQVRLRLGGAFNVDNAVMAAEAAVAAGLSPRFAAEALSSVRQVPGRFELVEAGQDFPVIVDYAHTPEGIEAVLGAARALAAGRVTVVLGAGGNRDRRKRPAMGRAAETGADQVVVTSDNPRGENPSQVIADIVSGMTRPPHRVQPDRRLAVRCAVSTAAAGDVIVIAGKGHERTQDHGDRIVEFDDRIVARDELLRRAARRGARLEAAGSRR